MQTRTYDEVDPFEVYKLTMASFGWGMSESEVRMRIRKDPRVLDGFAMYAEEDGRLLAQVIPLRMRVRLTTGPEEVGGLQGVCSHPSVWGKGYARRLMEQVHERFAGMDLRISTLTTSRNIRGYGVYRSLGYVDLGPFYRGLRRLSHRTERPRHIRLRKAQRRDFPRMHALFRGYTRGLCGWTDRYEGLAPALSAAFPDFLGRFRVVLKDGQIVGYLRTRPEHDVLMEEVIVPQIADFCAAVAFMESHAKGTRASVNWITCRKDQERFRTLGYVLEGPIADATMAVPLEGRVRATDLPHLFGVTTRRFAHYPTDDF